MAIKINIWCEEITFALQLNVINVLLGHFNSLVKVGPYNNIIGLHPWQQFSSRFSVWAPVFVPPLLTNGGSQNSGGLGHCNVTTALRKLLT